MTPRPCQTLPMFCSSRNNRKLTRDAFRPILGQGYVFTHTSLTSLFRGRRLLPRSVSFRCTVDCQCSMRLLLTPFIRQQ